MDINFRNVPQNDWPPAGRGTLVGKRKRCPIKREVWDGDRFYDLSWFWDPNEVWCLPARCKTGNWSNVISGKTIETLPESPAADGLKELFCQHCHSKFLHKPNYARGDSRNLAFIGKIYKCNILFLFFYFLLWWYVHDRGFEYLVHEGCFFSRSI